MTRAEVIAELRRSACEDRDPWGVHPHAMYAMLDEFDPTYEGRFSLFALKANEKRTLYLLVACALEDE